MNPFYRVAPLDPSWQRRSGPARRSLRPLWLVLGLLIWHPFPASLSAQSGPPAAARGPSGSPASPPFEATPAPDAPDDPASLEAQAPAPAAANPGDAPPIEAEARAAEVAAREAGLSNHPFVMRVRDLEGTLQGRQPAVVLDNGVSSRTFLPLDDGTSPDVGAGDRIFTLGVTNFPGSSFRVTVQTQGKTPVVLGEGAVSFDPSANQRDMVIQLSASGVELATSDGALAKSAATQQASTRVDTVRSGPAGTGTSTSGTLNLWWVSLVGLLTGSLGAWVSSRLSIRAAQRHLSRAGQGLGFSPLGPGLPGVDARVSLWECPTHLQPILTATLAEALAPRGSVLLVATPPHRDAHRQTFAPTTLPIWLCDRDRPPPRFLVRAAQSLADRGPLVSLVVEGIPALEPPHPDRPAAALLELAAGCPYPLFVVVSPADPPVPGDFPRVRLLEDPSGVRVEDGPRLLLQAGRLVREVS